MRTVFWAAFWVFLLDQVSKIVVVHLLDLRTLGEIDVLPPFVNLRMAWNSGINFGLFSGHSDAARIVLIAIALVIVGFVLVWVWRDPPGRTGRPPDRRRAGQCARPGAVWRGGGFSQHVVLWHRESLCLQRRRYRDLCRRLRAGAVSRIGQRQGLAKAEKGHVTSLEQSVKSGRVSRWSEYA